jgi:alpha-tubulin suppressor-like RCC1 family protein
MSHTTALPTEVRRRVQNALKTRNLRQALRSDTGAIDLASIMVGVIVIGVIAGIIAATVFAVIPWSQNSAAKGNLDAVRTAEGVAMVMTDKYQTVDQLIALGYLQPPAGSIVAEGVPGGSGLGIRGPVLAVTAPQSTQVVLNADATCYVAGSRSATGDVYFSTSKNAAVDKYKAGTSNTDWCTPLEPLVVALGGSTVGITVTPAITTTTLPNGVETAAYSQTLATTGTPTSFAVSTGTLPTGLILNTASGVISGTPTAPASFTFAVTATNTAGTSPAVSYTVVVASAPQPAALISAGVYHTLVIDSAGHMWASGQNGSGQLGDGTTTTRLTPVAIAPSQTFSEVATGNFHSAAIDTNGHLWTWGGGSSGQIGNGAVADALTPTAVTPTVKYKKVVLGGNHDLAIDEFGKLWVWGLDGNGQLGDGLTAQRTTPFNITPSVTYKTIAGSQDASFAIDTNGHLWTWGSGANGQLGNGSTTSTLVPTEITASTLYKSVSASHQHVLAVDSNKHLWAWGANSNGQLGNGSLTTSLIPVAISASSTFTSTDVGSDSSVALDTAGRVWSWGANSYGQLGLGDTTRRLSPTAVTPTTVTYTSVASGWGSIFATDSSNHLLASGHNLYGTLGDGTAVNKSSLSATLFSR